MTGALLLDINWEKKKKKEKQKHSLKPTFIFYLSTLLLHPQQS